MCVQFSREELDAFLAVKRAFDPPCLLNPEKVIPTLARCAEYGKMHDVSPMDFVLSELCDQVMTARAGHKPLFVMGGGSKAFYGNYRPLPPVRTGGDGARGYAAGRTGSGVG
ncbi:hypothetical protein G6F65_021585 [Rhizopus arrhizus]|nr:hypothetical protein G6F65_021585 [Rhizopus arrhizus]